MLPGVARRGGRRGGAVSQDRHAGTAPVAVVELPGMPRSVPAGLGTGSVLVSIAVPRLSGGRRSDASVTATPAS